MTRIVLSFACALALILIPLAYSPVWAQTTSPATTQEDRNDAKQDQTNPDLNQNQNQTQTNQDVNQNQSNAPSTDANSSGMRQKPSSSESNPSATQDQNRTDSYSNQTTKRSQSKTESQSTGDQATDQNAAGNRNLPKTAGELPLLALIGLLCLGAATGTSVLARARSSR